jgi:O-antigen/teichoic acid export membrane protein
LILDKVVKLICGIFVNTLIARHYGPKDFGAFAFSITILSIMMTINTLGMDTIIQHYLIKGYDRLKLLNTAFVTRSFSALIMFFFFFIYVFFVFNESVDDKLVMLVVSSAILLNGFSSIELYFQSIAKSKRIIAINLTNLLFFSSIKVLFISAGKSILWIAFVFATESFLMYFYQYRVLLKEEKIRFNLFSFYPDIIKELFSKSWPLFLGNLTIIIYMKIDNLIIRDLMGFEQIGFYSAATRISESFYFLPTMISVSFFPKLAKKEIDDFESSYLSISTFLVLMAFLISVFIFIIADKLILTLYGVKFTSSIEVLKIHIWANVFVFYGCIRGYLLVLENRQKLSFYCSLCGGIVNIILNYILIPIYGIKGAAYATLFSYFVATIFVSLFVPHDRKSFFYFFKSFNIFNLRMKV